MLPNFLLIGPGRSGSDWIVKNLGLHPQVYLPVKKSTRYFSDNYSRGLEWYARHFRGRTEPALGEASVGYLLHPDAPHRIAKDLPNVRLIATLRNPVDRAYSSYGRLHAIARPGEPNYGVSFEDKLAATPRLITAGLYATHLQTYFSLFPRENLLVLFFEDMVASPREYLRSIFRFLEVSEDFDSPIVGQKLNSTTLLSLKSTSWPRYYLHRALVKFNLFGLAKRIDDAPKPPAGRIDPDTRRMLIQKYYCAEIDKLEELTGRDLSHWKQA
jgi:hypothetical protein